MDSYGWVETEAEIEGRSGSGSESMEEEGISLLESGHAKDEEQQQNALVLAVPQRDVRSIA